MTNLLDNPQILTLFGVGVAIGGVGIQLIFQGLYIKDPNKRGLGNSAYGIGIFWAIIGLIVLLIGIYKQIIPSV